MLKHWWSGLVGVALLGLVLASACSKKDKPPPLDPTQSGEPQIKPPGTGAGGNTGGAPSGSGGAGSGMGTCGKDSCIGPSTCVEETGKPARCVCNEGYVFAPNSINTCIVDKKCIKIRPLAGDGSCRQRIGGTPAVASFFAVDFCAGTAVLEADLAPLAATPGKLDSVFKILENDKVIGPSESKATIIRRDVESYVTVALDVSNSIVVDQPAFFNALLAKLQAMVVALKPMPEPQAPQAPPPVGVSVLIFGKTVVELVPFTTNLDDVATRIGTLADPAVVKALQPFDGTALNVAMNSGMVQTERIIALRNAVTQGGVLSTGTLIVVTDGTDNSGVMLDSAKITSTPVNLISVGIGTATDAKQLATLGRDGAFLAPAPADLDIAFSEITKRVAEYPDRAYLLGYCSPAFAGESTVTISLNLMDPKQVATCKVNAGLFNASAGAICDPAFFAGECTGRACGGLTACGACADGACCVGSTGQCAAPAPAATCTESTLCGKGFACDLTSQRCLAQLEIGAACAGQTTPCRVGTTCGVSGKCEALGALGASCTLANQCDSARCERANVYGDITDMVCKRPAQIGELCKDVRADAACETGSACVGTTCKARAVTVTGRCTLPEDCLSGACTPEGYCVAGDTCQFVWDDKIKH
ncbi:MAG: VWA domain-containing protein [Polyangiaceae bacterium]|nr:VWA domain-containing protein [Polyangiaceae bacterium]